uniref:Uncharacterized protein n=1 Tax=Knipowitschia caucasica TaxID=637954 RepID=A0AAV2K592_KNICA
MRLKVLKAGGPPFWLRQRGPASLPSPCHSHSSRCCHRQLRAPPPGFRSHFQLSCPHVRRFRWCISANLAAGPRLQAPPDHPSPLALL